MARGSGALPRPRRVVPTVAAAPSLNSYGFAMVRIKAPESVSISVRELPPSLTT